MNYFTMPELEHIDARRICGSLGMSQMEERLPPLTTREDNRRFEQGSSLQLNDSAGAPVTQELVHARWEALEALPEGLLRKLAAAGHLYVIGVSDGTLGRYYMGHAHYTKPMQGEGAQAANPDQPVYRIPPALLHEQSMRDLLAAESSNSQLFVDLGAIEKVAFAEPSKASGWARASA